MTIVVGTDRLEIKDYVVGEVWVCSGQSNMQMNLRGCSQMRECPEYQPVADANLNDMYAGKLWIVRNLGSTPPADEQPPSVVGVSMLNTEWPSAFRGALDSPELGDAVEVGSGGAQLRSLPWAGINRIALTFSEHVIVDRDDLALTGIHTSEYDIANSDFSYDPATHTAIWTLPSAVTADKLLLTLNADGPDPVLDAAGNALDGEWGQPEGFTDPASDTFPSGDGSAGGDFHFRFNVLPGDANGNGSVNSLDLSYVKARLGQQAGGATYTHQADPNGNGSVNNLDLSFIKARLGTTLPGGEPAPAAVQTAAVIRDPLATPDPLAIRAADRTGGYALPIEPPTVATVELPDPSPPSSFRSVPLAMPALTDVRAPATSNRAEYPPRTPRPPRPPRPPQAMLRVPPDDVSLLPSRTSWPELTAPACTGIPAH